jgi:hypothetical protein
MTGAVTIMSRRHHSIQDQRDHDKPGIMTGAVTITSRRHHSGSEMSTTKKIML